MASGKSLNMSAADLEKLKRTKSPLNILWIFSSLALSYHFREAEARFFTMSSKPLLDALLIIKEFPAVASHEALSSERAAQLETQWKWVLALWSTLYPKWLRIACRSAFKCDTRPYKSRNPGGPIIESMGATGGSVKESTHFRNFSTAKVLLWPLGKGELLVLGTGFTTPLKWAELKTRRNGFATNVNVAYFPSVESLLAWVCSQVLGIFIRLRNRITAPVAVCSGMMYAHGAPVGDTPQQGTGGGSLKASVEIDLVSFRISELHFSIPPRQISFEALNCRRRTTRRTRKVTS
mmetsp:Transcript_63806/g.143929  ORF Transcript_63806/g.143929 Transcript_63806/m.143929 type:complete len:293 (+) Transcript_63806:752-1630(+)